MRDQIQDQLNEIYRDICDGTTVRGKFRTDEEFDSVTNELDGPFLINVSDEYLTSNPKVMIVGQENNGWIGLFGKFLSAKMPLEEALAQYDGFRLEKNYNSTFFQYLAMLRNVIHGSKSSGSQSVIWNNLFKFNQGMNPQMNYSEFRNDALKLQGEIFQSEIEILEPQIVIFLTGPYYDSVIQHFYPDVEFREVDDHPKRQLAQVISKRLPQKAFRTYHPSYLNRSLGRTSYCIPTLLNQITNKLGDKWEKANKITISGGSRKHVLDFVETGFDKRLNRLIGIEGIRIADDPKVFPSGKFDPEEMDLDSYLVKQCSDVWLDSTKKLDSRWWTANPKNRPQMDLICRIKIDGEEGLLFVEAKAHESELDWLGKQLKNNATENSRENHEHIMNQIAEANAGLNAVCQLRFNLTGSSRYQLANRLAYLWKLASCGIPCVLMYLGFVGDSQFESDFIRDDLHWQRMMGGYLEGTVPQSFPEQSYYANGTRFQMIIRSTNIRLTSR